MYEGEDDVLQGASTVDKLKMLNLQIFNFYCLLAFYFMLLSK